MTLIIEKLFHCIKAYFKRLKSFLLFCFKWISQNFPKKLKYVLSFVVVLLSFLFWLTWSWEDMLRLINFSINLILILRAFAWISFLTEVKGRFLNLLVIILLTDEIFIIFMKIILRKLPFNCLFFGWFNQKLRKKLG